VKDQYDRRPYAVDGFPASQWIVVDYGDVMVHLFHESKRPHYALEELWGDAPQVK
jgi:ribosome-associated protein